MVLWTIISQYFHFAIEASKRIQQVNNEPVRWVQCKEASIVFCLLPAFNLSLCIIAGSPFHRRSCCWWVVAGRHGARLCVRARNGWLLSPFLLHPPLPPSSTPSSTIWYLLCMYPDCLSTQTPSTRATIELDHGYDPLDTKGSHNGSELKRRVFMMDPCHSHRIYCLQPTLQSPHYEWYLLSPCCSSYFLLSRRFLGEATNECLPMSSNSIFPSCVHSYMKAVFRTSQSRNNNNPLLRMTSLGWFFDLSLVPQCYANGTGVFSCCNKAVNVNCPTVVDTTLYNLGVSFQTTNPICITGVGFNKASSDPAPTDLWNEATNEKLASSNSSSSIPDSSGWQESMFDSPFPMNTGDLFIASYLLQDEKEYAFDHSTFTSSTPVLQAGPVSAVKGLLAQNSMSSIPLQTFPSPSGSNYFVTPLWTHDLCVCGHPLDSDGDQTPDCKDGCPDDASFTDTCAVGCNIPIQQSVGAISGIFEAPVGSGNLYKLEYVVDLVDYGDAKFLVRPESHKMAFHYLGSYACQQASSRNQQQLSWDWN